METTIEEPVEIWPSHRRTRGDPEEVAVVEFNPPFRQVFWVVLKIMLSIAILSPILISAGLFLFALTLAILGS